MITWGDLYTVLSAVVPLYVAMMLAYGSVKWWKIFSPDQCAGINRFVAVFAVPLLSFHFISTNNIYTMNYKFIAADSLQKIIILVVLGTWAKAGKSGSLDWMITLFSLSTLPNTLVMGIPLLKAMYGPESGSLMVQVVVMQSVIWYTLMLFLFEYRGAKLLIMEQFPPGAAASIVSLRVDSDVVSLDGQDPLQAHTQLGHDGKLHVVVRKSTSSVPSVTPRPSNLTGAEIYSLNSSRNPTPRGSSFNHSDFYSMLANANANANASPRHSNFHNTDGFSRGTPRTSNFEDHHHPPRWSYSRPQQQPQPQPQQLPTNNKELHMFVWSSSASPVSEAAAAHVFGDSAKDAHALLHSANNKPNEALSLPAKGMQERQQQQSQSQGVNVKKGMEEYGVEMETASPVNSKISLADFEKNQGSVFTPASAAAHSNTNANANTTMPPASVMTRLILIMVWRKLIRNPNTYSSLLGLIWSLVSFRYNVEMPKIIYGSISILSDAGLGMAMFSLGLFMALQPRIIACGKSVAAFAMGVRFLTGPAVMAAASIAIGLRSALLHVAIVQAALPQGIVPFVFAKEYNVHPQILSTA
eukprot:TRINITY_DN3317_c0_g1_i2.p1 TRINITY_DN3317_c0_g1~~TRINITY_DN3317_c0_g1_i2.p1  ORF type:complete len:583 (-),score=18.84 TRINITY_DN3317_c0_g1_i2:1618-3366(-)